LIPEFAREEIEDKVGKISKASGLSDSEIKYILKTLFRMIKIVPKEDFIDKWTEALEIAKDFDSKDAPFIALALKLNVPIWTNDKKLIEFGLKTGKYLALDTQAVEELLKGKSLDEIKEDLMRRYS
jgi:predicted nucleic acid-binding protein